MKRPGVLVYSLFILLLLPGLAHADCSGIKLVNWKAAGSVYTAADVKITNTSDKEKSVYIICKHNDGIWYKIIGDKIKVKPHESVEIQVKTGGTWTTIIDMKVSRCE